MATFSLILSILASIGTIISLLWNKENSKKINNSKSITTKDGNNNRNVTGNNNKIK